jgi:hypothetical protein
MPHHSIWNHPNRRSIVYLGLGLLFCAVALFWLGPATAGAQGDCPNPYTVGAGDSWSVIARRCGVTVQELRAANPTLWRADQRRAASTPTNRNAASQWSGPTASR